ncbi:MLO-like protein 6 isoform X2 [Curcuma longa]|uniref:MLO-like protein 6 isoform X2 n=1 Tax=Curcuma longa TaxID=136217 RepID=UPI003D9F051F
MAAGGGGRSMEQTPTWAIAVVCLVLVVISILIEHAIHLLAMWLKKHHKRALYEALEKIKSELMLMGFISFLLTVGQSTILKICVPMSVGNSWHPCDPSEEADIIDEDDAGENTGGRRRLLQFRRSLAAGGSSDNCADKGKVALISGEAINQLHIFIFVLAVSQVLYCICTLALGRRKMKKWKAWELETRTAEYQFTHDPDRFRFARDTSFGRRHLNFWSTSPFLIWILCFLRQFASSVPKVDYLTLRHGFIIAHLAPQSSSKFNFQKYIKRSLEEDFKVVVGISPTIWFIAVVFLLFNTHGWQSYLWQPFIPLIIILLVGIKLQVIITKMAIQIMERGDVVNGVPVVRPQDNLFWFNRPSLLLFLIHFVLFQNAFQLAFFACTWYEFGYPSCFHKRIADIVIPISMGILIQVLCSYVTLPLYALVTQMGTNLKPTIFSDRVAIALRKWHHTARKNLKESRKSGSVTPSTSQPMTPLHGSSPVHLLQYYQNEVDCSVQNSPNKYIVDDDDQFDPEDLQSPSDQLNDESFSYYRSALPKRLADDNVEVKIVADDGELELPSRNESDIGRVSSVVSVDFSFDKRQS